MKLWQRISNRVRPATSPQIDVTKLAVVGVIDAEFPVIVRTYDKPVRAPGPDGEERLFLRRYPIFLKGGEALNVFMKENPGTITRLESDGSAYIGNISIPSPDGKDLDRISEAMKMIGIDLPVEAIVGVIAEDQKPKGKSSSPVKPRSWRR